MDFPTPSTANSQAELLSWLMSLGSPEDESQTTLVHFGFESGCKYLFLAPSMATSLEFYAKAASNMQIQYLNRTNLYTV